VEFWAAKKGNPHAEEHHAAAIAQARGLEAKLQELALARRGLLSQLAGQQGRLREIEEKRAAEQRERQRQEYEAHVQQAKTDAARAVQNAVEAYEGAAVRCGEATSAIEHLCAIGGNEGRFAGGQLIDELLAGCAPAVLEAKGYTVISEWQRPPYGRLEFRLLPVRASVPLAQES
jgi:hypothetical protein